MNPNCHMLPLNSKPLTSAEKSGLLELSRIKKSQTWITKDLKLMPSSALGRFFWKIFKHFAWARKLFYSIDLEASKAALSDLQQRIKKHHGNDQSLKKVFFQAAIRFNQIAPRHFVAIDPGTIPASAGFSSRKKAKRPPPKQFVKSPVFEHACQADARIKAGADKNQILIESVKALKVQTALRVLSLGGDIKALDAISHPSLQQEELIKWLTDLRNAPKPAPENLEYFALTLGLGYKTANLMVLDGSAQEFTKHLKVSLAKVPPFVPISDLEMRLHLFHSIPQLLEKWNSFLQSFDANLKKDYLDPSQDASKVPLKISNHGREILDSIQDTILRHYVEKPYFSIQLQEWIAKEKPDFLIIRSTGKEDSDTNSNAGGNESIPFVKPVQMEISDAIGQVIASYFHEKSIGQRLIAGDKSLFTERPFIPVVIQSMVIEDPSGASSKNEEIPRSGVLFSSQQEKAGGVTLINAGLGNNEGVVTGQVAVDSYYVEKDLHIHAIVRKKETRFVSIQEEDGHYAEIIKNEGLDLIRGQALSDAMIKDLKRVADSVSAFYSKDKSVAKPMDMEYTVKLSSKASDKPIIYLLQARPLQVSSNSKSLHPKSFIDLKALIKAPAEKYIQPLVLLDGCAYVRKIENLNHILFADDIVKAAEDYISNPKSDGIKAIIIKKNAPATSHGAVVLGPRGVAVFVIEDRVQFDKAKQMAFQAALSTPMLADPQRGIILAPGAVESIDKSIHQGLISYPIPLEMSLPMRGMLFADRGIMHKNVVAAKLELLNLKFNQLMNQLTIDPKNTASHAKLLPLSQKQEPAASYTIRGLFDLMASGDTGEAKLALATLLHILRKRLRKSIKETQDFRADIQIPMFHAFETLVDLAAKKVAPALELHKPQTLERLYPLKFLDALVSQRPNTQIVAGFSFATVLKSNKNESASLQQALSAGIQIHKREHLPILQLITFNIYSLHPDVKTGWQEFCKELSKDPAKVQEALKLIERINAANLTAVWMNTCFKNEWKASGKNALRTLKKLASQFQKNLNHLQLLEISYQTINSIKAQQELKLWSDPNFVKANIAAIKYIYQDQFGFTLERFSAFGLKTQFESADPFGRLSQLTFIYQAVETYDVCIKQIKGSTLYLTDEEKAKDIAQLLAGYFLMMESILSLVSQQDEAQLMQVKMGKPLKFQQYIQKMREGTNYRFGFNQQFKSQGFNELLKSAENNTMPDASQQLLSRSSFCANAFCIGSKADLDFSAHWPTTLEEYFTAFHQNMLKILRHLMFKNGFDSKLLSLEVKAIADKINTKFGTEIASITIEKEKIHIDFTISLRQHSALLSLRHDPKDLKKGFDFHIEMYGNDETDRWDQAAAFGSLLAHVDGIAFTDGLLPKIDYNAATRTGVTFSLHIPHQYNGIDAFVEDLRYMILDMAVDAKGLADPLTYPVGGHFNYIRGLMNQLEKRRKVNWKTLDERFFSSSFYLNSALLDDAASKKDWEFVFKVAKNSLIGLASQGFNTYSRHAAAKMLNGFLGSPAYQFVPNNQPGAASLTLNATLHLIQALKSCESLKILISDLSMNPLLLQKMPATAAALRKAVDKCKPIKEQFDDYLNSNQFADAFRVAHEGGKPEWIQKPLREKIATFVKAQVKSHSDPKNEPWARVIVKAYKDLIASGIEEQIAAKAFLGYLHLSQADLAELDAIKLAKSRVHHLANLQQSVAWLQAQDHHFDANYQQILQAAASVLIGLSQTSQFDQGFQPSFRGLENWLGKPKYNYVFENVHATTAKARKAAPLTLIRGFEHPTPKVRQEAWKALMLLATDFRISGKNSNHKAGLEKAIFAACRGYFDAEHDKIAAGKALAGLWNQEAEHLVKLTLTPYSIDKKFLIT